MAEPAVLTIACIASFLIALTGTGLLSRILAERGVIDRPNDRSSHVRATPRGGGIAVIAAVAVGFGILIAAETPVPPDIGLLLGIAFVLASVSWIDDIRGLPAFVRLVAQALCVAVSLYLLPLPLPTALDTLPPFAQYLITGLAWLWFINLYNFMDGIDGITGVETLTITLGTAAVLGVTSGNHVLIAPALVIAAAMPGFLKWNWPPARIFMGDVGSVTLGYLLGWLLIASSAEGSWIAVVIIPGYYLADATVTLIRRAFRGEKVWKAHRQHAYQQAVQNGMSHGDVSGRIGVLGVCLTGLALTALYHPVPAALAAIAFIGAIMHHFIHTKS